MGKIVYSKSGRDKGRMFVIIEVINNRYVVLVDGDLRKIENPKAKNIKHLYFTNTKAEEIIKYLNKNKIPDNRVIKNNLKKIEEARKVDGKEVW